MTRPSISQVNEFLGRRPGLIVHFSGAPPGDSVGGITRAYPADLHYVIDGYARSGLSCSVVLPGDVFSGAGERNAFGCIGVIVGFEKPESLIHVAPVDAGSYVENDVRHFPYQPDINVQTLEASLDRPKGHNEWGIRDYNVLGILAVNPFEVWNATPPGAVVRTNLSAVIREFPKQNIFTFNSDRLLQITRASALYGN